MVATVASIATSSFAVALKDGFERRDMPQTTVQANELEIALSR